MRGAYTVHEEPTPSLSLKKKRLYGPDVHLVRHGGMTLVEKTYRRRSWPVRILGRLLVRWETGIYAKLRDIPGIPVLTASPDACTLTTVFMGGHNLKRSPRVPDGAYFERLRTLIDAVHARGVFHLDMRNSRNYGMDDDGMPYLVDFASSLYLPCCRFLRQLLCAIDWMGYLKVKAKLNPDLISEEERGLLSRGNTLSLLWFFPRALRLLRHLFRRVSR